MFLPEGETRLEPKLMAADPALLPLPTDMELTLLRKINQIASALNVPVDPAQASSPFDVEFMALRKINQLLWDMLNSAALSLGVWTPATYQTGYSGTLQARSIGWASGLVELKGNVTGPAWTASPVVYVADLPVGLRPNANRSIILPSGSATGTPNSVSYGIISAAGQILIQEATAATGTASPIIAWFDSVIISSI